MVLISVCMVTTFSVKTSRIIVSSSIFAFSKSSIRTCFENWNWLCMEITEMGIQENLKQQVSEVAKKFFAEHMSMMPESIVVDIHSDYLVITLHNAISRAETEYTREKLSSERLDKFYKSTFNSSKLVFEAIVSKVFPCCITGSFLSLHSESGRCVVIISLCSDNAKKAKSN